MLQVLSKQHQPRKHKATETKTSLQDSMGSARTTIKLWKRHTAVFCAQTENKNKVRSGKMDPIRRADPFS